MTKFKQLSFWAREHKWSSRFIIVFSFITMNILALIAGYLMSEIDISLPRSVMLLSMLVFTIVWFTYPHNRKHRNRTYVVRKSSDALLIGTTFLMFIYFGNRDTSPFSAAVLSASTVASSLPVDSTKNYKSIHDFKRSLYDENGKALKWKERKKLLKKQVKAIKGDNRLSEGGKIALIIVCCVLALALVYVVAAISCSLSCSGSEGAAVLVAVLGLVGIGLLTFFLIRSIVRKSRREKAKKIEEKLAPADN